MEHYSSAIVEAPAGIPANAIPLVDAL